MPSARNRLRMAFLCLPVLAGEKPKPDSGAGRRSRTDMRLVLAFWSTSLGDESAVAYHWLRLDKGKSRKLKIHQMLTFAWHGPHLFWCQIEIFSKRQSQNIQIFASITECGENVAKYFSIFNVVRINQYDAVCNKRKNDLWAVCRTNWMSCGT